MLQLDEPQDFIVATGKSHSLRDFVVDKNLYRLSDIKFSMGNPKKAKDVLGWKSEVGLDGVISKMIEFAK